MERIKEWWKRFTDQFGPAVRIVKRQNFRGGDTWYVQRRYGFLGGWYPNAWHPHPIRSATQAKVCAHEAMDRIKWEELANKQEVQWYSGRIRW